MQKIHQFVFGRKMRVPPGKLFPIILLLVIAISPGVSAPLVTAYRASQPPRLDGVLDDPCWQAASLCQPFLSAEGRDFEAQNHARICWDDTHVYIAFECLERFLDPVLQQTARVTAEQKQHDSNVFGDDCVEFFLDIPGAGLFQFAANSIGTRWESKDSDSNWNCDWQAQALRGTDRYTVECAIPLAALGVKGLEGAEWRGNFCRERKAVPENTTWSGLQGAFNDRGQFGTIRFAAAGPALGATRVTPSAESPWRLEAEVTPAGASTSLVMTLTLTTGEKAVASLSKPVMPGVGGPAKVNLDLALPPEALSARKLGYAYELKAPSGVVYASPQFQVAFASGKAVLALLQAPEVVCQAFLDGRQVQPGLLKLHEGLNVLTLVASGKGGWVRPEIVIGPQRLPADERWLCATAEPPADWQTAARAPGFQPAKTVGQGIWAAEQAAGKVYFRRGLWMTPPRGRIFPNTNKVWLPAGTSQRLKPYLLTAAGQDLGEYDLCLRVPSYLRYVVADGIEGAKPREVIPVGIEELNGRSYTVYRATYASFPMNGMELSLRWMREDGSTITYQTGIQGGGTFDWTHFTTTVTAPAGAAMLHPMVVKWSNLDITGTFWVDNITVRKKDSKEDLLKVGDFEGPGWESECVIAGQGKGGSKGARIVSMPPIASSQQGVWIPEKPVVKVTPGMEYVIEMDAKAENLASSKARPLASLLFAVAPTAPRGADAIYLNFELGNGNVTEVAQEVEVEVLPPLLGIRPRKIKIVPAAYKDYSAPAVMAALADNFWRSGMSDIFGFANNELVRLLRQKGKCESGLQLDYAPFYAPSSLPDLLKQHPEAVAIEYPDKKSALRMCPTWTLTEGQEALAALEREMASVVKDGLHEGACWDLEDPVVDPPTYCFCPRCFEAFRGEAKLPPDLKLTAPMMLKEYRRPWTDFRCRQNAVLAGHIRKGVKEGCPGIKFSMYSGYQCQYTKEHYGVDWALLAPLLDLGLAGYNGDRKAIQDTMAALHSAPFMGGEFYYLSPTSEDGGAPNPLTWRNRLLRQCIESGGRGVLVWFLPVMDGGAFYYTSEAAAVLARYEDIIASGTRCEGRVKVSGLPDEWWFALQHGKDRLVLMLNFKAEPVTVNLKLPADWRQLAVVDPVTGAKAAKGAGGPATYQLPAYGIRALTATTD